jgi:hypothetical protein
MKTIEEELADLLKKFEGRIPANEIKGMRELASAGEPGIALENLCTQAFEYEIEVTPVEKAMLARLGTGMGISEEYWQCLSDK